MMPGLAIYNDVKYRVLWMGAVRKGTFAGLRRAKLQTLNGGQCFFVPATAIQFVDNDVKGKEKGTK